MTTFLVATAIACATAGGVFFAFSTFVMAGLARLPEREGLAAMQAINVTAVTPAFMTLLFGTALLCIGVAGWAIADLGDRVLALAGALTYLVGNIAVTMGANVPRNNRLAATDDPAYWQTYLREWTALNHVRTVTGIAAGALIVAAAL